MGIQKEKNTFSILVEKIIRVFNIFEENFITIFTLVIGTLIMLEIVMRIFNLQGIKWLEEMGRFMLITTTIMGCSIAVKTESHMAMDLIYGTMKAKSVYKLKAITSLLCGIFYIYLGYYACRWTIRLHEIGKTMESISAPSYIMWIFVSIGVTTMGFRYIFQTVKNLRKIKYADNELIVVSQKGIGGE